MCKPVARLTCVTGHGMVGSGDDTPYGERAPSLDPGQGEDRSGELEESSGGRVVRSGY